MFILLKRHEKHAHNYCNASFGNGEIFLTIEKILMVCSKTEKYTVYIGGQKIEAADISVASCKCGQSGL